MKPDNVEILKRNVLISVIVPVYNVEKYLERCIKSILSQTYQNFEIILVDDGSTDTSSDICNQYGSSDERIIVIHKKNGGLSDARNTGLRIAKGEFITFVDSDDMIVPNALEILIDCSIKYNSDIVISTKYEVFDETINIVNTNVKRSVVVDSCEAERIIFCENTRWEAWGTLYKACLLEGEEFPVGKLYEDLALIPLIVLKAKKVCFVEVEIYCYFQRVGSIMNQSKTKVSKDLLEICENLVHTITSAGFEEKMLCNINSGILMELCSRVDLAERNYDVNKEFILESRSFLRKKCKYVFKSESYNLKRKLNYMVVSSGFGRIWRGLYNLKRIGMKK